MFSLFMEGVKKIKQPKHNCLLLVCDDCLLFMMYSATFNKMSGKYINNIYSYLMKFFKCCQKF